MTALDFVGIWHCQGKASVRQNILKLFYSLYYILFPISLVAGAIIQEDDNEFVFLIEMSILTGVLAVKNVFFIWRNKELHKIVDRSATLITEIDDGNDNDYNNRLSMFQKFVVILLGAIVVAAVFVSVLIPYFGFERSTFFKIAFPLDWKNNLMAYWLVSAFIFTETFYSIVPVIFSVLMWYSLLNCSLAYRVLGTRIRNLNTRTAVKEMEGQIFDRDFALAISCHQQIREYEL